MATDVAQVIRTRLDEIEEQLDALEPLRDERERLQRALQELDEAAPPARRSRARTTTHAAGAKRSRAGRRSGRARTSDRAPRGQNLKVIAAHVDAEPGSTAAQISAATGIDRAVVYSAVSRMTANGRLTKTTTDDGSVTYRLAGS